MFKSCVKSVKSIKKSCGYFCEKLYKLLNQNILVGKIISLLTFLPTKFQHVIFSNLYLLNSFISPLSTTPITIIKYIIKKGI